MKLITLLSFLFLFACNNATPHQESEITTNEKEIAQHLIQGAFDDLWGGMDSTKILDYHTEDFVILEHGEVWDNDRIKQFMRDQLASGNTAKRVNIMDYISIDKYGQSMQIAYHNKGEFYVQDSLVWTGGWLESAVAVNTSEGWRLKMMHSTRKSSN